MPPAARAGTLCRHIGERTWKRESAIVTLNGYLASCDRHCQGYPVKRWAGIVEQVDRSMTDEIMLTWHKGTTATAAAAAASPAVPNSKSRVWLALRVLLLSMMYRFGVATLLSATRYPLPVLPLGLCPSILVGHLASRHAAFVSALQILMRSDIYAMLYTFHAI